MTTQEKGDIGELIIAADLLEKGFEVFKPIGSTKDFDLLIMKDGQIRKVQVKSRYRTNGFIEVPLGTANVKGIRYFDKNVVDFLAICDLTEKKCYYVSMAGLTGKTFRLRFNEASNNQQKHVHLSNDFVDLNF